MNIPAQLDKEQFQLITDLIQRELQRYWQSLHTIGVLTSLYVGQEVLETERMLRETLTIEENHVFYSTAEAIRYLESKGVGAPNEKVVNS
jgi:hypothetical protein